MTCSSQSPLPSDKVDEEGPVEGPGPGPGRGAEEEGRKAKGAQDCPALAPRGRRGPGEALQVGLD